MHISCLVKSLLNRHSKSIDTFSENHISLRVRGAPMLHPHYAHWFESRRVNAGWWWLDTALVDVLAILALDQAYNFRCFPADKNYEEALDHWYEMRVLRPTEKSSRQKVTKLNFLWCRCQVAMLSPNPSFFEGKKGSLSIDSLIDNSISPCCCSSSA